MGSVDDRVRRRVRRATRRTGEDDLLVELVALLRAHGHKPWHTPNERAGSARAQGRLNAKGVRAGVADLLLHHPTHVLAALELKAPGRKPTAAQIEFLDDVRRSGGLAAWADSEAGALGILRAWGYLP